MANGEGYLRKRSEGSWTMTIWLGKNAAGKPQQLVRTMPGTEKEAKAEMARLILERRQGVDLKPQTVTVAELFKRWLTLRGPDLAPVTQATYSTLIKTHILPVIGQLKLRDVKPLHIEAVKAKVIAAGRSPKSALNVHRLLNAVLKQAVLWQLLSRNPCDSVKAPRPKRFVPHMPTTEELQRLLEFADLTPYGPVARLAALTGARQGELLSLRWRDVDWLEQLLTVSGTKTVASARVVDLGNTAIELLRQQRQAEKEKRLKLGPGASCGQDDATIFTNLIGKPMDAGGLKRTWKRILRDAGVGHVRFHDLRHASATFLLRAGVPVKVVAERLGHSRTSTTTDTYAHVMPDMGREAAEALESLMVKGWSKTKEA